MSKCQAWCLRNSKCGSKVGIEHLLLREDEAGQKKILPKVYEASEPNLLLWKNYKYNSCDRCCRSFWAWVFYIFIILGAFYLANWALAASNIETFDFLTCGFNSYAISPEAVSAEWQRTPYESQNLISCFCYQEYKKQGNLVANFELEDGGLPCKKWFETQSFS